jgi:hypothetical protein
VFKKELDAHPSRAYLVFEHVQNSKRRPALRLISKEETMLTILLAFALALFAGAQAPDTKATAGPVW